jgi:hypothetical protein
MALLTREDTKEMSLGSYLTIAQGARLKGVRYHTLRAWLAYHPEVHLRRVDCRLLVREVDLERYIPQGQ